MRAIRCRSFLLLRRDGVWDEYHGRLIHQNTLNTAEFVHQTEEETAIRRLKSRRLHRLEEAKRCGDQKRQENAEIQPMAAEHRACAGISHTGFSCIENSFPATEICLPHDSFCASHKRNHRY